MALLDTGIGHEKIGAGPGLSDLVEVGGLGQFWVSNGWKTQLHDHAYLLERKEKERQDLETTGLVFADLPTFLGHVINVVANYRDGDSQLRHSLTATESRPVLRALAAGRLEKLDWNKARWQGEVGGLFERGAGVVRCEPGSGLQPDGRRQEREGVARGAPWPAGLRHEPAAGTDEGAGKGCEGPAVAAR